MVVKFAKYIFSNLKKNHYRSTYPIFILFMLTSPKKKSKDKCVHVKKWNKLTMPYFCYSMLYFSC